MKTDEDEKLACMRRAYKQIARPTKEELRRRIKDGIKQSFGKEEDEELKKRRKRRFWQLLLG